MNQESEKLVLKYVSKHEATISYKSESLSWNIFPYFKGSNILTYDIFEQINDYLKQAPDNLQKNLFETYKKIHALLELPTQNLDNDLKTLVAELFSYTDIVQVKNWVDIKANIVVPSVLEDVYEDSDENTGNRNRTYVKEDYRWLITLATLLRLMTPIWGEYITKTSKEKGNIFKEYYAASLLESASINKSVPMTKLKLFVIENIPKDKSITSALMAAFSAEDFPDWLMRLVVVRKLCLEDIRGIDNNSHLIKVIFQYIKHRIRTVDGNFFGIIKEKFTTESNNSSDDNNNLSKIEGYKIRQEVAAGDIALIRISLKNPHVVARKLCPDINIKFVDEAIHVVQSLENEFINKSQKAILQYVFKPICPPSGMLLLNKVDLVRNMGVALALLWNSGWHDIAALMTAIEIPNDEYLSIGFSGVRARITKAQYDKLEYLYPYTRRPQGKQRIIKNQNVGIADVERLSESFINNDWKLVIPQQWIEKEQLNYRASRYTAPADIRIKFADFIIAIADRELPFAKHKSEFENKVNF